MYGIVMLLLLPLKLLDMFGGLISAGFLVYYGDYLIICGGLVYWFFGHYLLSLAVLPGFIFNLPLTVWKRLRFIPFISIPLNFLSLSYTAVIIGFSDVVIFLLVSNFASKIDFSWITLVWAYSTATAPWGYMANIDRDDTRANIFNMANHVSCLFLILSIKGIFGEPSIILSLTSLVVPLLIAAVILTTLGHSVQQTEQEYDLT